ncbi:hypothetical protein [Streptomyces sp. Tu102]|uniref:hypothetical protein n=1 Tax=Streptomyces sp. Tu102 TaxID=2838019 RepID=UPI001BDDA3EB|nr:hypothetical protein [Streptomyces sp. Tu102]MBT1093382.1 hypothetical protein [Streptomyces sp. Tu102]
MTPDAEGHSPVTASHSHPERSEDLADQADRRDGEAFGRRQGHVQVEQPVQAEHHAQCHEDLWVVLLGHVGDPEQRSAGPPATVTPRSG